ncbi:MAG: lyase family protein [Treponema sp.]|jgi:aspartate ammonia-lyase|nr:lyase family protein [Treponema sp.]
MNPAEYVNETVGTPASAGGKLYYGPETQKALSLLGNSRTPRVLIRAYGEVKLAAIYAQQETAQLYPAGYFPVLEKTALDIIAGKYDNSFPLPLAQGGAGTSLHMNICEVLANAANERYEAAAVQAETAGRPFPQPEFRATPLDHLARFQSTNDTFPTAVIIMTYRFLESIENGIIKLQENLVEREKKYEDCLICGRTELQDALPMTLGQVYGAWAGPVERDRWRMNKLKERLRTIPLGGTAIGTGFSAPLQYVFSAEKHLRRITKLPLCRSQNLCDAVAHTDSLAECAGGMGLCADNLYKMTNDLLLYTSSVNGELHHGELQYGSTIMPDKVNPVILELVRGLCMDCASTAHLITDYSRSGQWQLNANLPFLTEQMIHLDDRLERALNAANGPLMQTIAPDAAKMELHLASSPALLNALRDILPYTKIKTLLPELRKAAPHGISGLIDFLVSHTDINRKTLEEHLDTGALTGFSDVSEIHGRRNA